MYLVLSIIVIITQLATLSSINAKPLNRNPRQSPHDFDLFEDSYYDAQHAQGHMMMPGALPYDHHHSLLSPAPISTPFRCRLFPHSARCLNYQMQSFLPYSQISRYDALPGYHYQYIQADSPGGKGVAAVPNCQVRYIWPDGRVEYKPCQVQQPEVQQPSLDGTVRSGPAEGAVKFSGTLDKTPVPETVTLEPILVTSKNQINKLV